MSQQELQQGRAWVEDLIRRLARERGVEVTEPFQWYHDFNREVYWLEAVMNGIPKKWSFSFEKLSDCVPMVLIRGLTRRKFSPAKNGNAKSRKLCARAMLSLFASRPILLPKKALFRRRLGKRSMSPTKSLKGPFLSYR